MKKKTPLLALGLALFLWLATALVDFARLRSFEKPVFCVATRTLDGGSRRYVGLGYSFNIKGNFSPEEELPGVTKYTPYVFGKALKTRLRD